MNVVTDNLDEDGKHKYKPSKFAGSINADVRKTYSYS